MSTWYITIGCGLFVYAVTGMIFFFSPKEQIQKRLNRLAENVELEYIHDAVLNEKKKDRKMRKTLIVSRRFEDYLATSGLKLSAQEYVTLWVMLSVGPVLIGVLLELQVVAILGLCIVGFSIPPFMVQKARKQRQQLFNKQLGESLTIMSNCMRSGYSFQQAMGSIAREMQPPISTEFARVVREMNYGTSMEQALNNMVARVENKDLELLVSAVLTSQQVGANLSEILDTIADTVSDRIKLREEVQVLSAQGRMSGIIIGMMPIVIIVFLMVLNPNYITGFVAHPIGRALLIVSGIMELLGFYLINKIVDIKY